MTLQVIQPHIFIPGVINSAFYYNSLLLDANGEKAAFITYAPKTGNIRKIGFITRTVTVGDTMKVSLQGIDASGNPDGTIKGATHNGFTTIAIADTDDNIWKTTGNLGEDVAVTRGEPLAVVIEFNSWVAGNLNIGGLAKISPSYESYNFYSDLYTVPASAWAKSTSDLPTIGLEYDDGSYAGQMTFPTANIESTFFKSSSTPNEYGNYFQVPFPCRVVGAWVLGNISVDAIITLYVGANPTIACSSAQRVGTGNNVLSIFYFNSDIDLAKDTWYRVSLQSGSNNNIELAGIVVPSAAAMDSFSLGQKCYQTTRTDGEAWTETTTKRRMIGLLVDAFDDAAGGAGGLLTHPGMSGGCRG